MDPLPTLVALATELALPMTLDELLQRVLGRVGALVGTPRASVRLFDATRTRLFLGARLGEPIHQVPYEQQPGQGLLGWVAQHGRALRSNDAEADPRFIERKGQRARIGSFLGMPLVYQGHTIGVISVVHEQKDHFTEAHEQLVRLVAGLCAPHLEVARLARLACLDPITQVLNPESLTAVFPDISPDEPVNQVSLLYVGIDSFAAARERLGQEVADVILRTVARVLAGSLRVGDAVIRYGDDAFLLVVPGVGVSSASRIAERARAAASTTPIATPAGTWPISVSIGVAERLHGETREELVMRAGAALGLARARGGDSVRVAPTEKPSVTSTTGG